MQFKLICFDLNETLIEENTWKDLNLAFGITPDEDRVILDDYESGRTTYEQGQKRLEKLYLERGLANKQKVLEVISKYKYRDGAKEIIAYLRDKSYEIALLSGSIDLLVERVANELSIKHYGANNVFKFNENGNFLEILTEGRDSTIKVNQLKDFCQKLGIKETDCVCVGDGISDQELFLLTQHGITFKGSRIEKLSWKSIDKLGDLKSIL